MRCVGVGDDLRDLSLAAELGRRVVSLLTRRPRRGTMRFGATGAAELGDFACDDGNAASDGKKCVSRGVGDDHLMRNELTVLEQADHLLRRSEILAALGERAQRGWNGNQYTEVGGGTVPPPTSPRTTADLAALGERAQSGWNGNQYTEVGGGTVPPPTSPRTTADLAAEMGISERSSMMANNAFRCVEAAELRNSTGLGRIAWPGGKKCVSRGIWTGRPGGVSRLGGVRGCW